MSTETNKGVLNDYAFYVNEHITVSSLDENHYFSTENMLPNRGGVCRATSLPEQEKVVRVEAGDILISNIRPYFKKIWLAKELAGCSNDVLCIRAKSMCLPEFLFYYLSSDIFFDYVMTGAKGTKMPRGDKQQILHFHMLIPSLDSQKQVISILSCIDKKIQLNAQINQNLEQQIQAIFSHLINDPASFYSKLGDVCKCVLGGTPDRSKPEYWNGDIPWINSGKVNDFRITTPSELITEDGLKRSATKLLPSKTTVLAITGATLGQVSLLEISACANQSVIGVIGNERTPYTFIYPFIKAQIGELMAHQTGGAQQHINKQNVEDLPIPIYAQDKMAEYDTVARPLFDAISCNCFESLRLATLRDTLLPKLMSGEIDVSEVEI